MALPLSIMSRLSMLRALRLAMVQVLRKELRRLSVMARPALQVQRWSKRLRPPAAPVLLLALAEPLLRQKRLRLPLGLLLTSIRRL
jgi:hypothetical protein